MKINAQTVLSTITKAATGNLLGAFGDLVQIVKPLVDGGPQTQQQLQTQLDALFEKAEAEHSETQRLARGGGPAR